MNILFSHIWKNKIKLFIPFLPLFVVPFLCLFFFFFFLYDYTPRKCFPNSLSPFCLLVIFFETSRLGWNLSLFQNCFSQCLQSLLDIFKAGGQFVWLLFCDLLAAFSIVVQSFLLEMHFSSCFPGHHSHSFSLSLAWFLCWSALISPSSQCWLPHVSVLGPLLFIDLFHCNLIQSHGFQGYLYADNF